jgi:hypothetical protein
MKSRALYLEEWVRIRNGWSSQFPVYSPCSICKTPRRDVYYSIKTKEVRCRKCFDAEAEHYRREPLGRAQGGGV